MTKETVDNLINRATGYSSPQKKTLRRLSSETIDYEGWRDMLMDASGAAKGAGTPTLVAYGPSANISQYEMGIGDSLYFTGHVDHDWLVGSLAHFHVHWSTGGTNTQPVRWEINYTIAKGHNQANFPATQAIYLEEAAHGTAWRHMITEDQTGIDLQETDAIIMFEVKRVTNGGTDNTDNVFIHMCDLHYRVGQVATPNKSPDFFEHT